MPIARVANYMCCILQVLHFTSCVANSNCCKLRLLQTAIVANCKCCKLQVVQTASVANCKCCKLQVLQITSVANCKCCKLQVLQITISTTTSTPLDLLQETGDKNTKWVRTDELTDEGTGGLLELLLQLKRENNAETLFSVVHLMVQRLRRRHSY